jgi:HD-GYP domain-containing protein (c-di-GMP phosphodiesterase class II)
MIAPYQAYVGFPITSAGRIVGVIELLSAQPLSLSQEQLGFLEAVAAQMAIAIDKHAMLQALQRSHVELSAAYDATLEGWARALELRDQETEGHSRRVTELTIRLAQAAGVSAPQIVHIRRGALLHDIGKIGINDAILLSDGPLDDAGWSVMRRHPDYAVTLLEPIAYLQPALEIPKYHHERWDGSGYPCHLSGEAIPLAARIFAIVDVWDALTSDRPYRKAWTKERTLQYIQAEAGKSFDPALVALFVRLVALDTPADPFYNEPRNLRSASSAAE